jgi:hypothetical protein
MVVDQENVGEFNRGIGWQDIQDQFVNFVEEKV